LTVANIVAQLNVSVNKAHELTAWLAGPDLPLSESYKSSSLTAQDTSCVRSFKRKWHGRCSIQSDLRYYVAHDGSLQSVIDRDSHDSHFDPDSISQSFGREGSCVNETGEENPLSVLPLDPP